MSGLQLQNSSLLEIEREREREKESQRMRERELVYDRDMILKDPL